MLGHEPVFTIPEVAGVLRVSDETIRRKIDAGELSAVLITAKPRKSYRILYRELARWLGDDTARVLFQPGDALDEFRNLFADMNEEARDQLIHDALAWTKAQKPKRERTGKTVSAEAIKDRFA